MKKERVAVNKERGEKTRVSEVLVLERVRDVCAVFNESTIQMKTSLKDINGTGL